MNICIIGQGFVGKATALTLKHEPIWHDPPKGLIADYKSADVVFICCFDDVLDFYLEELQNHPCAIVRTTLVPAKIENTNFAVYPEFLVERTWEHDALNPIQIVFGGTQSQFNLLKSISVLNMTNASLTSNKIAALMKVSTNSFLALKVSFMNLLYQYCKNNNMDFDDFVQVFKVDTRMGHTHFNVPGPDGLMGYGGKCFPKDALLLSELLASANIDDGIIKSMVATNTELRKI